MPRTALKLYANAVFFGALLLAVLSLHAFYPTYLGRLGNPLPWVMHLHAALMAAWMGLLVLQSGLIRRGNISLHRTTGRLSYALVPLLLLTAVAMIAYSYERGLGELREAAAAGRISLSGEALLHEARKYVALPVYYFVGFALFYPLAMLNRRRPVVHAQFMLATMLMLTGPVLDRSLYFIASVAMPELRFPFEWVAFILADFVFVAVLVLNLRRGESWQPAATCLACFLAGQSIYRFGLDSRAWQSTVGLFF